MRPSDNMFLIHLHISLLLFIVTVTSSRSFSPDLLAADASPINQIANRTYGTEIEKQLAGSLTSIFSPRMDFEQWKPLTGRGDPLRNDPTYDYEPPVLERVHYWAEETRLEREHFPERKSEVLMLGVSSRKPSVTSRQPPIPPRRHVHRPQQSNKYEDYTYKLSNHYPMTILVPPPRPPPGHQPPLFILSENQPQINNNIQSEMKPHSTLHIEVKDSTTTPEHQTSTYALQESNLIYQSSTTTQNWITDANQTKSIVENAVSSDYAGWGPTTPVDDNEAANYTHNLILNDHVELSRHPYAFYRPMLSESPPPAKIMNTLILPPTFIPTVLPTTTPVPSTAAFNQVTWPTEPTAETFEVSTETPLEITTEKRSTMLFQPTPITTTTTLETNMFDMIGPMMSMPMINGPERPEDNLYAHASENVHIFNEHKEDNLQIETMQTMQPPPPAKPAESSTMGQKKTFHVNSQVSNNKPALYTHGPYLHMRFTTPIPTTVEEFSDNVKSTSETPVPMYLIIQGHSKVKTYGSKPKATESNDTINNEISKPLETNEVKHLHPIIKKSAKKLDLSKVNQKNKTKTLRTLVDSGLGSIEIQETDIGIKYDVSDGSHVPIEIYRKGIVDNAENNYSLLKKIVKEIRTKRQIELEDLLPFDEEAIEEYVYNFLDARKNETGITGLIAQAVTSDAASAVDEIENDNSEQEEER